MVFSSITFLILFFPVVFLLYNISKNINIKNIILVIVSLIFYGLGEPYYIFLMLMSCLVNYMAALIMDKTNIKKPILITDIIFNIGILGFFKYSGFLIGGINELGLDLKVPHIIMPLGISFFTFQSMSYVIDCYRGETKAQKNFLNIVLYISFFPQLIAGPIIKYHDFERQIKSRYCDLEKISSGIRRFIMGLSKKVIIANTLGQAADGIFAITQGNVVTVLVGAVIYTLQIYYDFSGYSDMAIGLSRTFGFDFLENFDRPYRARSIKEFWRKWHISLSTWFKEYVYIPLGGNRVSKGRTVLNKFIVFFITGLWHGAGLNFIIWGLYHGFFSVLEEKGNWIKKIKGNILGNIYTMFVVITAFLLFRNPDLTSVVFSISKESISDIMIYFDPYTVFIFMIALIGVTGFSDVIRIKKFDKVYYGISVVVFYISIMILASGSYNPFIYFRF